MEVPDDRMKGEDDHASKDNRERKDDLWDDSWSDQELFEELIAPCTQKNDPCPRVGESSGHPDMKSQEGVVEDSMVQDHTYQSIPSIGNSVSHSSVGPTAHTIKVLPPNDSGDASQFVEPCLPSDRGDAGTGGGVVIMKERHRGVPGTHEHDDEGVPDDRRLCLKDGTTIATVAPSSGGDNMIPGKHNDIHDNDISCQGDTAHSVSRDVIAAVTEPGHTQTDVESSNARDDRVCVVRDEFSSSTPAKTTDERKCEHKKGGICLLHGPGAKLRMRPIGPKIVSYVNGRKKTSFEKEYFYVCDLGPMGSGKKLKQTKLSFLAMKTTDGGDNAILGLRGTLQKSENTATTEGQQQRCVMNS